MWADEQERPGRPGLSLDSVRSLAVRKLRRTAIAISILACALVGAAQQQDRGNWQAASNTAARITGDIAISNTKLTIDFMGFVLAPIRGLKPAEVSAVFDADANAASSGALYRLSVPGEQRFLHKNTLCGTESTQWMATYVAGKTLEVAFFSGEAEPVFTFEAIAQSPNLCGTYTYVR
jgi:hypothetical protein